MPPSIPALLLEKILSFKDRSPLITVLDSCSQSARPLLKEFARRATQSGRKVIYISFEDSQGSLWARQSPDITVVRGLKTVEERMAGSDSVLRSTPAILKDIRTNTTPNKPQVTVVIIDSITPLFLEPLIDPIQFLGSLLSLQIYSAVLSHNTDVPLSPKYTHYPSAQPLLSHISTTVLRVMSFDNYLLRLEADSMALPDPVEQDRNKDGVVSTLGSNSLRRIVISLEYRRKTGRITMEKCIIHLDSGKVELLDTKVSEDDGLGAVLDFGTTFNLGITQEQKKNKENVVLPHFSAQRGAGSDVGDKESASIEYTLEAEDDFDDEEDVDEDLLI